MQELDFMITGVTIAIGFPITSAYMDFRKVKSVFKQLNPVVQIEIGKPKYLDFLIDSMMEIPLALYAIYNEKPFEDCFKNSKFWLYYSYIRHRDDIDFIS